MSCPIYQHVVDPIVFFSSIGVQVYVGILKCGNIATSPARFLDVVQFIILSPLSLLIVRNSPFQILSLKISSTDLLCMPSTMQRFSIC
jgi:hypothetical protein